MKPYYDDGQCVIYHGDCLEALPQLPVCDLLLTDPPYGIGAARKAFISHGKVKGRKGIATDHGDSQWDDTPASQEHIKLVRSKAQWQVIFGGNYFVLPPARCWLVWDKEQTGEFADCELAWTNLDKAVRRITHRWSGMLQQPGCPREPHWHPTQKPEAVMRWALMQAPADVKTVLDPFMGSGTTLVAAKRLGRKSLGIEIEERYCEIAAQRLAQGALDLFGESA